MNVSLCIFRQHDSVQQWILDLGVTKQGLKKFKLSKTFLQSEAFERRELQLPLNLLNKGRISPTYCGPDIAVLYEDETFLVFDKPQGVHGHSLSYLDSSTVLAFLRTRKPELLHINQSKAERGLLNRLDGPTSGVLIYVKNEQDLIALRSSFHDICQNKYYLAIVSGKTQKNIVLRHYLSSFGKRAAHVIADDSRDNKDVAKATLELNRVDYNANKHCSLCLINLHQGHRHQIRSQLSASGFPILGDELYGASGEDRLYLHAYRYQLKFRGVDYDFISPVPKSFERFANLNTLL